MKRRLEEEKKQRAEEKSSAPVVSEEKPTEIKEDNEACRNIQRNIKIAHVYG